MSTHASQLDLSCAGNFGRKKGAICIITMVHVYLSTIILHELYRRQICSYSISTGASAKQYLESVAQREIDWIKAHASSHSENNFKNPWLYTSEEQTSPEAHISSLRKFLSAIPEIIPKDSELISPRLWHPDFHAGNVYIDEQGKISSIIDWQSSWVTPLFIGPNPPSVLDYGVEMMMKLPDNYEESDQATKEQLRYQVSQSILIHSYESRTASENPLMYKMMRHPQGKTLKHLEAFAGATWENLLFPLKECLIIVER